jgi:hypothetical protein
MPDASNSKIICGQPLLFISFIYGSAQRVARDCSQTINAGASSPVQDAGKTKSIIPPALRAAMTAEVEQRLRTLIRRHGAKKLHDALLPLLAKCKLNEWLCGAILPSASNGNRMSHPGESAAAKIKQERNYPWLNANHFSAIHSG